MNKALLAAVSCWFSLTLAGPLEGIKSRDVSPAPVRAGFRDVVSTHAIPMRKHDVAASMSHPAMHRRARLPVPLKNIYDVYYSIDLKVGNQTIAVSVDTGSSDTWMVQQPYECVSFWFDPAGEPDCGLGVGFQGNLSGGRIPNLPPFVRSYVDGTFVSGFYGLEEVSIGDVTAHNQRLALVNYTYWHGDGQTSGLLGLAYPYLTSLDGADQNQPPYSPVFTTMWESQSIDPLFSIALSRTKESTSGIKPESYLALGGLPPVDVDEKTWARTPIHGMRAVPQWGFDTDEKGMYIIKPDAFVLEKGGDGADSGDVLVKNTTQIPILIDVGATLSYLPKGLVNELYAAFDPPARYMSSGGLFYALCNATVPNFGVQIEESVFYMAKEDLLRQTARDPTGEWCRIGITDTDSPPHVLGESRR
ncbi:aspartic peptidase domain-containing protein [Chaetomium tenue]|uniref:Aspartic peptidase domain-containing protein n=1 Tax=Chaetomium tenue TaxID=1854479 RepID=A0ACB7PJA3_9PEZI|nr:aspartic peptidase domain-containing protein [Chaetomium globosum]